MQNFSKKSNYYEVLEVATDSTLQDIHNAYVRTKNAYTGDSAALYSLMSTEECQKIVDQIEEAYSVVGVPEKRREYDQARGFNQSNTPEGFNEEIMSRPSYVPQKNPDRADRSHDHQNMAKENALKQEFEYKQEHSQNCLLYTSPSPRDRTRSRMPSSA